MAANDWLAQDLADMLELEVERPAFVETTALGAAMLAGVGAGLFGSLEEAAAMRGEVRSASRRRWRPTRARRGWRDGSAVAAVLDESDSRSMPAGCGRQPAERPAP